MKLKQLLFVTGIGGIVFTLALLTYTAFKPHPRPGANDGAVQTAQSEGGRGLAGGAATGGLSPTDDPCRHIHSWICSKKGVTRDPTGLVRPDVEGEKMALKIYEDIIQQHTGWNSDQVNEELVHRIYTPDNVARLESAHHWVRNVMERIIDSQPESVFNAYEKNVLKARLQKTELQMPIPVSSYGDEGYLFTKNDVFYERTQDGKMRLRVGGAYFFTARSWFNQVFTLGHELAHSIDPCEIRSARISIPAYDRLSACFMDHGLVAVRQGRFECGENDQLSETFADWFAVQVTAEALRGFSMEFHGQALLNAAANAVRDLCEQNEPDMVEDTEFHPSPKIRISRIFGRNPDIREILGCPLTPYAPTSPIATASPSVAPAPGASPLARQPASDSNIPKPYCGFDYQPHSK